MNFEYLKSLKFIKIARNGKNCITKDWQQSNNQYILRHININHNNVALPCGKNNNIIIVDVDYKNEGIEEMNKYYEQYGYIDTLKQLTPNGGYHLFFQYNNSNEDNKYLIDNYLKNYTNLRNKGIDIRTNKAYIMISPSQIDSKKYIIEDETKNILEIPSTLLNWLLEGRNITNEIKIKNNETYLYETEINDDLIHEYIYKLPLKYQLEYGEWLKITTICKYHNCYDVWDEWNIYYSNHYDNINYNKEQNINIWNSVHINLDINYMIYLIKTETGDKTIKYIKKYKDYNLDCNYEELFKNTLTGKTQYFTDIMNYNHYINNLIHIVKGDCGSGKTYMISQYIQQEMNENSNLKLISIVALKSLSKQHEINFENINIQSYLKVLDVKNNNIVICVNSLLKYKNTESFDNYIIYIDEIHSFLSSLTHNDKLKNKKSIFNILVKMVKTCKRLILSDAHITEQVLTFLKIKDKELNDSLYSINEYKKYNGKKAIHICDENHFIIKMMEDIQNNKYFLCPCDSLTEITRVYDMIREWIIEHDDINKLKDMILITDQTNYDLFNANIQFHNKWVFYSPKITYGLDFSNSDNQNVYYFMKGNSIDPSIMYQQIMRTRNIDTLYYYIHEKVDIKELKYYSYDECVEHNENILKCSNSIKEVCLYLNENDDDQIIKNSFFTLYCQNEYMLNCYNSNKLYHFQKILKQKGFILSTNINPAEDIDYTPKDINEYNEEIDSIITLNVDDEDNINIIMLENQIPKCIYDRLNYIFHGKCSLNDYEECKEMIFDDNKYNNHFNILKLCKNQNYILEKLKEKNNTDFKLDIIKSSLQKVYNIKLLELKYNLNMFELSNKENYKSKKSFENIEFDDNLFKLIKYINQTQIKDKPKIFKELLKLYVSLIRNIAGYDIIKSDREKKISHQKKRYNICYYELNEDFIKKHIELDKEYSNHTLLYYDINIINKLNIEPKELQSMLINTTTIHPLDVIEL